jgi:spore coat polysaccharide biosynthesis protein SpsF (cytidylyltransferase family)
MKIVASIEVRMTSSRLPGKVLMPILNKPVLELLLQRVKKAKYISDIIIATTSNKEDDPIEKLCTQLGIKVFRGSEPDVLGRVHDAHSYVNSDIVVELTGDNPLIDPALIDLCVLKFLYSNADYVSTVVEPFFPYGQAIQVFSFRILKDLNENALTKFDREHVTPSIYNNPKDYKIISITGNSKQFAPDQRHTLDTQEDFDRIKYLIENLSGDFQNSKIEDFIPLIEKYKKK